MLNFLVAELSHFAFSPPDFCISPCVFKGIEVQAKHRAGAKFSEYFPKIPCSMTFPSYRTYCTCICVVNHPYVSFLEVKNSLRQSNIEISVVLWHTPFKNSKYTPCQLLFDVGNRPSTPSRKSTSWHEFLFLSNKRRWKMKYWLCRIEISTNPVPKHSLKENSLGGSKRGFNFPRFLEWP